MSFPKYAGTLIHKGIKYNIPYDFWRDGPMRYYFDLYPEILEEVTNLINNSTSYWKNTDEIYSIIKNELFLKIISLMSDTIFNLRV